MATATKQRTRAGLDVKGCLVARCDAFAGDSVAQLPVLSASKRKHWTKVRLEKLERLYATHLYPTLSRQVKR